MRPVSLALAVVSLVGTGCGQPNPEPEPLTAEEAASWAPSVSALAAYLTIYAPLALYDGQAPYSDPNCPVVARTNEMLTITGGCVDTTGQSWTGSAWMDVGAARTVSFDKFGSGTASGVTTQTGTASIVDSNGTSRLFTLDLQGDDSSIQYSGVVDGAYGASTAWGGSGTFTQRRTGALEPVDAKTVDEVFDSSICDNAPASGSTSMTIRGHHAVVTYDGDTDCDGSSSAELTIDGGSSTAIAGVGCSLAHPARSRGPNAGSLFALFIFAAFARARRACGTRPCQGV